MIRFFTLTGNGLMAAALLATPLLSQTDPNSAPYPTSSTDITTTRADGFDMGWLGLLGLIGLAGLIPKTNHQAGYRPTENPGTATR